MLAASVSSSRTSSWLNAFSRSMSFSTMIACGQRRPRAAAPGPSTLACLSPAMRPTEPNRAATSCQFSLINNVRPVRIDLGGEAPVGQRRGRGSHTLAVQNAIREQHLRRRAVDDANALQRMRKTSRSLSPTASYDALDVELAAERLLHGVDDRELGGALLALA